MPALFVIRPKRLFKTTLGMLLIPLLLLPTACGGNRNQTADKIAQDSKKLQEDFDNSLTFSDLTLEGFDKQGRLWWKVKANKASYSKDKKIARVDKPAGELYQDGKPTLQVSAQSGEVNQDGQSIFLRGNVTAIDKRNGLLMKGSEAEWQPKNDLLIVRGGMTGTYKGTNVAAQGGQFLTRAKRLELTGNVTAVSQKPAALFKSDRVVWLVDQKKLMSDRPVQIAGNLPGSQSNSVATSGQGSVDLNSKTATLNQGTQITLTNPPIQVSGNALVWNLNSKTVVSDSPITLYSPKQGVRITGDRGRMDINTKTAYLNGNIRGVGERNKSTLAADSVTYNLNSEEFVAEGNVNYKQANPSFNLTGPRAVGKMQDQTVVVNGGRVVTQFDPSTTIR
jgi:LPS export ABC transporter protein LptC